MDDRYDAVGNEAKLRRFEVVRDLLASNNGTMPDAETIEVEVKRRLDVQVKQVLERSRGLPNPVVLRNVLTEEDISSIFEHIDSISATPMTSPSDQSDDEDNLVPGSEKWMKEQERLTAALSQYGDACADDEDEEIPLWVHCSALHEKAFLHCDDRGQNKPSFPTACPSILEKLAALAREHGEASGMCAVGAPLNIRCIEFHRYAVGGGLMDPGHCDTGSILTLSVQLSSPEPAAGGRFLTTDADGATTEFELARGDAILFSSLMVHNVTPLTSGHRHSMVVEWWGNAPNRYDRDA